MSDDREFACRAADTEGRRHRPEGGSSRLRFRRAATSVGWSSETTPSSSPMARSYDSLASSRRACRRNTVPRLLSVVASAGAFGPCVRSLISSAVDTCPLRRPHRRAAPRWPRGCSKSRHIRDAPSRPCPRDRRRPARVAPPPRRRGGDRRGSRPGLPDRGWRRGDWPQRAFPDLDGAAGERLRCGGIAAGVLESGKVVIDRGHVGVVLPV